jgi:hypothetical protein
VNLIKELILFRFNEIKNKLIASFDAHRSRGENESSEKYFFMLIASAFIVVIIIEFFALKIPKVHRNCFKTTSMRDM